KNYKERRYNLRLCKITIIRLYKYVMEYKKLFDIEYNNKTFTLFLGKDKRIAFLEKGEQDKYFYPAFEDFKVLNKIYNVRNPFIFYSSKKAFFKEKVLLASGILAIVMSIYPLFG